MVMHENGFAKNEDKCLSLKEATWFKQNKI